MRHMRSRRILAMLLALSMIFGLLTTTALADNEVDQNTSTVGESAANGTSESGSGEGQSSGASDGQPSQETNKKDVPTEEETTPEEKKTTSSEEVDTQVGEGKTPVEETTYVASIGEQGYASLDAAIQAAVNGDTVTLLGNVELTETLTISSKDITLDVGSNTLTVSVSNGDGISVENATLTLESSSTGKYVFACTASGSDGIFVSDNATLNLNGDVEIHVSAAVNSAIHAYAPNGTATVNINAGKITASGEGTHFSAIVVDQNATLNMNGGEFDLNVNFDSYSDGNDVVGALAWGQIGKQENITVNISGGTFKVGGKNAFAQVVQIGMKNGYSENCDVSITGGTVKLEPTENGTGYVYAPYKASYATAAISGGTVTGTVTALVNAYISDVTNDGLTVTGGTFTNISADEMSKYLPEGTTYDETTGKVSSGSSEKLIETSEELAEAIANASDGDTIKLAAGEFPTYGNPSPKKSLTFVGSGEGTVWTIGDLDNTPGGEKNGDYSFDGCDTITFKNMTLKSDGADYRGFIRISNTIVDDCVLSGKTAYWGYETAKFINSKFNAPEGDYALWDYSSKSMSFDGCEFNISGKGVNVYVEAGNAGTDARKVEVKDCTVTSTKENKAFLNIKNSTQAYDVTISGNNTVNGLAANGTTGSNLYQVEATEITEASGKPLTVKQVDAEGKATIVYQVKNQTGVATVDGVSYDTLKDAFAALSDKAYTLTLNDESAWDATTPVYWKAGNGEYSAAASLVEALTAAYKAKADAITIICRPNADVGEMTHGHVADDLTIYGNNAYVSAGECDLEVDTYKYDRSTGMQYAEGTGTDADYLGKDITITAYELDNLGVWGQRHTSYTVNVNLTNCDTVNGITVQCVYISGETGVNNITLSGCDFGTKATSVYSNADGDINITNCSFTGAQVPVNFNHKTDGEQTLRVSNCEFNACGDAGEWKQFAAPVRFVNSGSGSQTATVDTCTFAGTVGTNGDILIGDGRTGEKSNDVSLTVTNTEATVMAQKPGYYTNDGTTDNTLKGEKVLTASESLTVSTMDDLIGGSTGTTKVAKVGETEYETLAQAIAEAGENSTVTLLADVNTPETTYVISKSLTIDLNGKTITGSGYDGVFQIDGKGAHVLIKNGNVVAVEQSGTEGKYAMAVWACAENCVVTLEGLTVTQDITHTDDKQMDMIYTSKGTIIINSGSFTSGTPAWTLNCKDAAFKDGSAKIIVNGGTFTGFDPCNNAAEGKGTSFVAEGVGVDYDENGSFTAKDGMAAQVLDADGNSVKAYKTLADAFTAASEGQTVRLLADATEDVTINKNITLDLGGKTLTNTGAGKATIAIANGATATVKNGSVVGGKSYYNIAVGTAVNSTANLTLVDVTATAGNNGSSMIDNWGTLTIESGTYTGGLNVVKSEPNAVLTITGGKFTLNSAVAWSYTGVILTYGTAKIEGGEFVQNAKTPAKASPCVVITAKEKVDDPNPSTEITGGTFTNNHTSINAKIFHGMNKATSDNFEVKGGTFNKSIPEGYCADGFIPTKNADGTYGVKEGKYVAKIGSTGYETLAAAIAKANSKTKPVTLVADVTESIEIAESKTCKIDLNGFTLTNTEGSHTIVNNGTLTIMDSSAAKSGTVDNVTHARAAIVNYGTMTLAGGTYTRSLENPENNKDSGGGNSFYTILNDKGGSLTIKDGVTVTNVGHFSSMICNGNDAVEDTTLTIEGGLFSGGINTIKNGEFGKLTINGGSFTNATQCVVMNWNEASITGGTFELASGVNSTLLFSVAWSDHAIGKMTISGGTFKYTETQGLVQDTYDSGKYTGTLAVSGGTFDCAVDPKYCAEGFEPTKNVDGTYGVKETLAAKIGTTEYDTLAAAFAAAKDGETIVLLKNSSGNGIQVNTEKFTNQGLTVDFNGHTYTVGGVLVGSTGTGTNAFQLLAGGKVTFMNGSIVGVAEGTKPAEDTPNWHGAPAMMIQNYCDLTLQSMTISGGDETVYTMSNNHGNVVIKDTTINAGKAKGSSYSPYAFDVCGYGSYTGVSVSVENSTINGNIELSKSKGNTYDATLTLGSGTTVNGSISVGDNGDKVAVTKDNSVDVTAPDGYKWVDGETGQTLAKIVMVAEVNGTGYETLAEAFAAATDNSTIKLLTDITLEGTTGLKVKAENAMNIVFDLNGHSITGSALSATTPALYIVSACGRDTSGSVKIINSSTEKAAISAKLPLQIFGSSYADEVRVEIDENVTLEVLEGGTNAIKMVQSAAYLVATEHTKTFYKNGGFMTTVNDEERIHEELSSAQKFSKNVKLLNDFATSSYLKIWDSWGTVTLDLDGHTYKSTAKVNMFELQEGANITFKKGTLKGSGDSVIGMPYNNSTLTLDSVAVENTGNFGIATNGTTTNQTVTINNSTIKVPNGMGVYFPSTGKLTINGGSIEANTGVQICAGSLEITGNPTIKATATAAEAISSGSILDGAAVSIVGGRSGYGAMGQVTIDSGSFTSASGIEAVQAYTVNSNNQKADWTDAEAKVNISGGSYSTPVRENLCAEGFVPVTNGDGTYGVQPDGNVAEIGSVKYTSLDEALKAAKDRETVKLLKDVEATQVLVTKGTLDLNGKTLKVSYFMSFSDVIDSTEGNGLIETGVQSFFTTNNSYLPLRDSAANGYRLFSYKLNKLGVVEGSSTAFWFNIIFGGEKAYSLLNTAGHNADLFIPMQIGSGNEWQYIKMNQSTLTKWTTPILNGTAPSRCGYYVNITGLNTLTSGTVLTLKTSIRSCGVEKLSDDSLTYTVK